MDDLSKYDDNVARLAAKHPALFEGRMPDCYSHLPSGWFDLVDTLCTDVEEVLGPELAPLAVVRQIKEKFGTLRMYIRLEDRSDLPVDIIGPDDVLSVDLPPELEEPERPEVAAARERVRNLVDAANDASATHCHICGAAGSLRRCFYIQTLCEEHFTPEQRAEEAAIAARASRTRSPKKSGDENDR